MKILKSTILALALTGVAPAWAVGGLTDLNIYDRTEGRRLQVYWHQGKAWVVGKPGNEYQVSLRNRVGDEVLAVVSVDGVNVVTGETASPQQSGYVLSPRGGLDIQGWRKNLSETAAFYFTALPDSYAARTGRPDDVGVIGVALFRKKVEMPIAPIAPAPLSQAAPRSRMEGAASDAARSASEARLGTGHGRRETSHARHVQFERATSAPAETVTLYYDSHRNLVARGVIREPAPFQPSPRPFPGFVPDPYS
jgi:hypothetical protein